jgi:hypothetical protein
LAAPANKEKLLGSGASSVKSNETEYWYRMEKWEIPSGIELRYLSAKNVLLAREKITLTSDKKFLSFDWTELQTNESATIERAGNKLNFRYQEQEKVKQKIMDLQPEDIDSLVVSPMLSDFLLLNWEKAEKAGKLDVKIAVPDRIDVYSFRFELQSRKPGEDFRWLLEAKSFFVRLIAGEIVFVYSPDRKLKAVRGVRPPLKFKIKDGVFEERKTDIEML